MVLSIGVVGCGWWSNAAHLPAIHDDPRARLVAVCDPSDAKRQRAAAAYDVDHEFARWEDMLEHAPLDAVVVATPPSHHYAPAAAALSRGLHVLVEKPMVVDPGQAAALVSLAEAQQVSLSVGYTFHHTAHVIRLRDEISSGRIGTVEHVSCTFASIMRELLRGETHLYRDGATGFTMDEVPEPSTYSDRATGGQAHSQLTHSVALALHLTGLEPARVAALTAQFELDVDLADSLAVAFAGGALGAFDSAGTVTPGHDEILQLKIFGHRGHVLLDPMSGSASIHGPEGAVEVLSPLSAPSRYPTGGPVANMIGVALGLEPNRAPGHLGARVSALIDAALRSARDGVAVDIAPTA